MTVAAVRLGSTELTKETLLAQVGVGESRIVDAQWTKIAVQCKGELVLLSALKVTDKRVGGKSRWHVAWA